MPFLPPMCRRACRNRLPEVDSTEFPDRAGGSLLREAFEGGPWPPSIYHPASPGETSGISLAGEGPCEFRVGGEYPWCEWCRLVERANPPGGPGGRTLPALL